jgi:hypothetical protein
MAIPGVAAVVGLLGSTAAKKGAQEGAKQVAKKKMSKKKKAAIAGGGVIFGGKVAIGRDGKPVEPVESGATGISTSDAVSDALTQAGGMVGMSGSGATLSGLQKGGVIVGGGTAFFEKGAGANYLANLQPNERAQVLLRLGQIPGLYAKGQAPTPEYIQRLISGGDIVPRAADFAALEQVAAVAEWSGATIDDSIVKLISQPGLAQQFFGKVTATPKKVTNPRELEAQINDKFADIFSVKAEPEIAKAYAKEINKIESSRTLGSEEKEDILLKYIQKKAKEQYNLGDTTVLDKGALGRTVRNIRSAYADNGIPINERDIFRKGLQSLRSTEAAKNIIDSVLTQASAVMPAFKDFFSQGKTAREVLSPWINTRAEILGVPADQIKVSDMYDVGSGPAPLSIQDYKKQLYKSAEYKKTDSYKQRSLDDMQSLLRAFNIG